MEISDKAALADTNVIVFGHCHCLFLVHSCAHQAPAPGLPRSLVTSNTLHSKFTVSLQPWSSKRALSHSGDAEAHKNCSFIL